MNLGEKIKNLIGVYQDGDKLKVFFTSSEDQHKTVSDYVWDSNISLKILRSHLADFEKYGECAGCDPKGHWVIDVDFKLIK